jgi:hypothetical protein
MNQVPRVACLFDACGLEIFFLIMLDSLKYYLVVCWQKLSEIHIY